MAYCNKCGAQLQSESKFCAGCGTPAEAGQAQTVSTSMKKMDEIDEDHTDKGSDDLETSWTQLSMILNCNIWIMMMLITMNLASMMMFIFPRKI